MLRVVSAPAEESLSFLSSLSLHSSGHALNHVWNKLNILLAASQHRTHNNIPVIAQHQTNFYMNQKYKLSIHTHAKDAADILTRRGVETDGGQSWKMLS